MNKIKALEIINELNNFISNPHSELNFHNNYELIIMVILSAQTTDKRVNEISIELFNKYNSFKSLANANYQDVYNIIRGYGKYLIELLKQYHQNSDDIEKIQRVIDQNV